MESLHVLKRLVNGILGLSIKKIISHDGEDRLQSIHPFYFLSLPILSTTIGDGDFIDSVIHLSNLGGHLRFKAKTV